MLMRPAEAVINLYLDAAVLPWGQDYHLNEGLYNRPLSRVVRTLYLVSQRSQQRFGLLRLGVLHRDKL